MSRLLPSSLIELYRRLGKCSRDDLHRLELAARLVRDARNYAEYFTALSILVKDLQKPVDIDPQTSAEALLIRLALRLPKRRCTNGDTWQKHRLPGFRK